MQADNSEEEGMRQQQRMKTMTDMIRKIKAKGRMDPNNSWWTSELLAADCKNVARPRVGGHSAAVVQLVV